MFLTKLKQYNPNYLDVVKPTYITDSLLDEVEIIKIKDNLNNLQKYWINRLNPNSKLKGYYLPPGMYDVSYEQYLQDVANYKPLMSESFKWFYEKILVSLEQHFKVPMIVPDSIHYPGFNLYRVEAAHEATFGQPRFHVDAFYGLGKTAKVGFFLEKFLSDIGQTFTFVVPISAPAGTGLIYTEKFVNIIPNADTDLICNYKPGALIFWSGNLLHAIKSFKLTGNQTRITLQGHINLLKDKGYVFW